MCGLKEELEHFDKRKVLLSKTFSNANCTADTKLCLSGSIFDAIGLFARIAKLVTITYIFYIFMQKFDSIWLVCLLDENFWFGPNQYPIHIYIVTNSNSDSNSFLIFFLSTCIAWNMNHNMNRNKYENCKTYRQRDDFVE